MKLISCHIENYGSLSDRDISFDSGITCIYRENGAGKSTLASFIRSVLYGMDSTRKGARNFEDRTHYLPFAGGKFGGSLTLEKDGEIYRIERTFDSRTRTRDTLKVYLNDEPFDRYDGNIGEIITGMDLDTFTRTVFINSETADVSSSGSISSKLIEFVNNTDDGNYESAVKILDNARKKIQADKNANDLRSRLTHQIRDLRSEIASIEELSEKLGSDYKKRNALAAEIKKDEEDIKKAGELRLLINDWQTYDEYLHLAETESSKLRELTAEYPEGYPDEQELAELKNCIRENIAVNARLSGESFGDDKQNELTKLDTIFAGDPPDEDEVSYIQDCIKAIGIIETAASSAKERLRSPRREELKAIFSVGLPDTDTLKETAYDVSRCKHLHAELERRISSGGKYSSSEDEDELTPVLFVVIAVLVMLIGAVLLVTGKMLFGLFTGIIGVILMFRSTYTLFNRRMANITSRRSQSRSPGIIRLRADISACEERILAFLAPYGYDGRDGVVIEFADFCRSLQEYHDMETDENVTGPKLKALLEKKDTLIDVIGSFFGRYGFESDDMQRSLNAISVASARYEALVHEKRACGNDIETLEDSLSGNSMKIRSITGKYGISLGDDPPTALSGLEHDIHIINAQKAAASAAAERAENFRVRRGLEARPAEKYDAAAMDAALYAKRQELAKLDSSIESGDRITELLPDRRAELADLTEQLDDALKRHRILVAARDMLRSAEDQLKKKYADPVLNSYFRYTDVLEKTLGEKVIMDKNYQVYFEKNGEYRSERHLSDGQRSLCALCLRLALTDNMFHDDKPILILDDPFTFLDDVHMKKAAELLTDLASDRQIIYFCCHMSRKV